MSRLSTLVPSRRHLTAFLVVAFPLSWFVLREASASPRADVVTAIGRVGPPLVGVALTGYLVAVLWVALFAGRGDRTPRVGRSLRASLDHPDDTALAVLAVLLAGTGAYMIGRLFVPIPSVVDTVLTPIGLFLGLPLLVSWLGLVVVGTVTQEPSMAVQVVVIALALSANAVWFVAVAGWLGRLAKAIDTSRMLAIGEE